MEEVNLELKHNLNEKLAKDVTFDYESSVKELMRSRKCFQYLSTSCSIFILFISFVAGIVGVIGVNELLSRIAGAATLMIAAVERVKTFSDNNYSRSSKKLSRLYQKSGRDTLGLYDDTDSQKKRVSNSSSPS